MNDKVRALDVINLRRTRGYLNKPDTDIVYAIPAQSELTVIAGPVNVDGLVWWGVRFVSNQGNTFSGGWPALRRQALPFWPRSSRANRQQPKPPAPTEPKPPVPPAAQTTSPTAAQTTSPTGTQTTAVRRGGQGNHGRSRGPAALACRRSSSSATDVIYRAPANAELTLVEGPEQAEGRTWWRVRYVSKYGNPFTGWAPVTSASGGELLRPSRPAAAYPSARAQAVPSHRPTPPDPKPLPKPQPPGGAFRVGDSAITVEIANLRRHTRFPKQGRNGHPL